MLSVFALSKHDAHVVTGAGLSRSVVGFILAPDCRAVWLDLFLGG